MFTINNAQVFVYTNGKYVSHIVAHMADQDYDALMAMGRGKMYQCMPYSNLRYDMPGNVMVSLRTD